MKLLNLHFLTVPWPLACKQGMRSKKSDNIIIPSVEKSWFSCQWLSHWSSGSYIFLCSRLGHIHSRVAVQIFFFTSVVPVAHNLDPLHCVVHMTVRALELIPTSVSSHLLSVLHFPFFSPHCLNASQSFENLIFICFRFFCNAFEDLYYFILLLYNFGLVFPHLVL